MARYTAPFDSKRRSVDLQFDENSTSFAPGRARERSFDFDAQYSANRGNAGALIPIPRYKERDISESIDYERGPYGERERERYSERDVYESAPPPQERSMHRHIHREEYDIAPHHHHQKRSGSRIKKREHTTECICLECVRARRYGEEYRTSGQLIVNRDYAPPQPQPRHEKREKRERERERERRTVGYGKYEDGYYTRTEMDVSEVVPYTQSPRNSGYLLSSQSPRNSSGMLAQYPQQGSQDWTVVDVPPGTRRITVEPGSGPTEMIFKEEKSIRRTKGGQSESQGELWTEITKDLVTTEALDEFGYQYEETEFFIYIFEYLHRDQIQDLIELTKDIRRERVKDIEYYDRMERMSEPRMEPRMEAPRPQRREPQEYYERDRYESREVYYT